MEHIINEAIGLLSKNKHAILALVLGASGSTPRKAGAAMLIAEDGKTCGTIGGGIVEYTAAGKAKEVFEEYKPRILDFDLGSESQDAICGGKTQVCLYPLKDQDLPALQKAADALETGMPATIALFKDSTNTEDNGSKADFGNKNCVNEVPICGSESIRLYCVTGEDGDSSMSDIYMACESIHQDERLLFKHRLTRPSRLWLLGAGHVSQATAKAAAVADFDITVADDRAEYANEELFPGCRCIVCSDFAELPQSDISSDDYIVIVTRGHKKDYEALAWAIKTNACYVGMIGSKRKRDMIYEKLESEGVERSRLEWVHSPIGLPIGDRTPGDIAISITAELIKVRADAKKS